MKAQRYEMDACFGYGCSIQPFKRDDGEWTLAADTKELEKENARLRRACSVLYHGVDEDLQRLAENEYSGCASTQRDNVHELRKVLGRGK